MRLRAQLRTTLSTLTGRTPLALEWAGLATVAYGVSRIYLNAGIITAGLFILAEALTTALKPSS